MKWLKLMRVYHYIKNILVFLPLIFSGQFLNITLLGVSVIGFISFCLLSSTIYIINDMNDIEKDRLHTTKCKRPLASGDISINQAKILLGILLGLTILVQFLFSSDIILSLFWLGLYLVSNILYSLGLKNKPIIDIAILVSGFLIRVLYGGPLTDIELSSWLILPVMSASFYIVEVNL